MDANYKNALALKWMFAIIIGFVLAFTIAVYLRTYYMVNQDKQLLIIYFVFKVKTLNLEDIKGIEVVDSPMSGARYALSSDSGLSIKEGKYNSFFINPKDKKGFIQALNLNHSST